MAKSKTTELWLARDPDGYAWCCTKEPTGVSDFGDWEIPTDDDLWFRSDDFPVKFPAIRKGTKRRVRVTLEVIE